MSHLIEIPAVTWQRREVGMFHSFGSTYASPPALIMVSPQGRLGSLHPAVYLQSVVTARGAL